ncbi:MAG: metallophosphoesterase [Cytophagales bacterium]|nr:MAG: metallophosphoesterase [Cytophagales bacterium]
MKIGLISDTHSYLDPKIFQHFQDCDEIWHSGDFGNIELIEELESFKPLKGVYGNIDDQKIRAKYKEHLIFSVEGIKIYITHIGGYPNKYNPKAKAIIEKEMPQIFICGHSHILKIMTDKKYNNMLYINPGAAGLHGFHTIQTIVTFEINQQKISAMKVIEIGTKKTAYKRLS